MFADMTKIQMLKLFAPLIVVELALIVFCLYRLSKDRVRFLPKWAWVPIIIFINLIGPLFYLFMGRERD